MSPPILTLAECFSDWNERFPKDDTSGKRLMLGEFTGASQAPTIYRWLSGKLQPGGEYKWRSVAFFALLNYRVHPFENARPLYQEAIQLLALEVVTGEQLATMGFGFVGVGPKSRMYQVFDRNGEVLPENEQTLRNFIKQHTQDLLAAKQLFDEHYGGAKLAASLPIPEQELAVVGPLHKHTKPLSLPKRTKPDTLSHEVILTSAANLAQGLLPLLELIASDIFSAAERAELRELAGRDGIFKLSNVLENLCGERARNQSAKQGAK